VQFDQCLIESDLQAALADASIDNAEGNGHGLLWFEVRIIHKPMCTVLPVPLRPPQSLRSMKTCFSGWRDFDALAHFCHHFLGHRDVHAGWSR
jgi:hypothetical protein